MSPYVHRSIQDNPTLGEKKRLHICGFNPSWRSVKGIVMFGVSVILRSVLEAGVRHPLVVLQVLEPASFNRLLQPSAEETVKCVGLCLSVVSVPTAQHHHTLTSSPACCQTRRRIQFVNELASSELVVCHSCSLDHGGEEKPCREQTNTRGLWKWWSTSFCFTTCLWAPRSLTTKWDKNKTAVILQPTWTQSKSSLNLRACFYCDYQQ